MLSYEVPKAAWRRYFDQVSTLLAGRHVDIEEPLGPGTARVQTERLQLEGLSFDPRNDALFVHGVGLDHRIDHAERVSVVEGDDGTTTLTVEGSPAGRQRLRLRAPVLLADARHVAYEQ